MNLFKELHALRNAVNKNKNIILDWKKYNPGYFIKNSIFISCDFEKLVFDKKFTINQLMHFKTGNEITLLTVIQNFIFIIIRSRNRM